MKPRDRFYNSNIHKQPVKKLTPVVLVGDLHNPQVNGIVHTQLDVDDWEFISKYQDFNRNKLIAFSPHALKLSFYRGSDELYNDNPVIDTIQSIPALKIDPKVSESIDLRTRLVKTSSMKVVLHDMAVRDFKLTDMLGAFDVEGKQVRLLWVEPDIDSPIDIYQLQLTSTQSIERTPNKATQLFLGTLHNVNDSQRGIDLLVEDASFNLFSKDIPIARMSDLETIQERYRLKPLPMVYGFLDKCPLIIFDDNNSVDDEFYLLADDSYGSHGRTFSVSCNAYNLWIGNDSKSYLKILRSSTITITRQISETEWEDYTYTDATQVFTNNGQDGQPGDYYMITGEYYENDEVMNNPFNDGMFHVNIKRRAKRLSMKDKTVLKPQETILDEEGEFDYNIPAYWWVSKGDSWGFEVINQHLSFDSKRNTHALIPHEQTNAYYTIGSLSDIMLVGPGLDAGDVEDTTLQGLPELFLNDGSKSNQHQSEMQNVCRPVADTNGAWGILGSGAGMSNLLSLLDENGFITDELENMWRYGEGAPHNEALLRELYGNQYEDIIFDAIVSPSGDDRTLHELADGTLLGIGSVGYWGIDKDAIMEMTDDDNEDNLMSNLLNVLYPEYCGGDNKQPFYFQHFTNIYPMEKLDGEEEYQRMFINNTKDNPLLWNDLKNKTWFKERQENFNRTVNPDGASETFPSNTPFKDSFIEMFADKLGILDDITVIRKSHEKGNSSAFSKMLGGLVLHAQGVIGGLQVVLYADDHEDAEGQIPGMGQCKQLILPWTMELTHDHNGNAFGASTLRFFRTADQLSQSELNEGWNENTLGNTLYHWYLSVESFLGGIEGVISNTNYESNFDDNNGDFSDGTYAQEGRNEQLTFDRATFWNFVDFYWAETYSNDTGWKNYGDLDYWTPQASLVYFISPNEDRILTSVNPTGDARLQAFEPYAINDSDIWYTFKEDLYAGNDEFSDFYAETENDIFGGTADTSMFYKIGKLSGLFLKDKPQETILAAENHGGLISTFDDETDVINVHGIRLQYKFDSIGDTDIVGTGTTFDCRIKFNMQTINPSDNENMRTYLTCFVGWEDTMAFELLKLKLKSGKFDPEDTLFFNFDTETPGENGLTVSGTAIDDPEEFIWENTEIESMPVQDEYATYGTRYWFGNGESEKIWRAPNLISGFQMTFYHHSTGQNCFLSISPYEVGVVHDCLIQNVSTKDYFGEVTGRQDPTYTFSGQIRSAVDIINHIMISELGIDPAKIDPNSTSKVRGKAGLYGSGVWSLDFALTEIRNGKSYIEYLNQATNFTTKITSSGIIKHICVPDHIDITKAEGWDVEEELNIIEDADFIIKASDVIKYKFKQTGKSKIITRINIKFGHDHLLNKTKSETGYLAIDEVMRLSYDYDYDFNSYGIEKTSGTGAPHPTTTREYTFKEVDDLGVARRIRKFMLLQFCNTKLTVTLTLPPDYAYAEVGDICYFDELIHGKKPFDQDYTKFGFINGQLIYPLFMVTKIETTTSGVKMSLQRMLRLDYGPPRPHAVIVGKTAHEVFSDSEYGPLIDRGISYTGNGYRREAHNPFIMDEKHLPSAGEMGDEDEDPSYWEGPMQGNINGDVNEGGEIRDRLNVLDVVMMLNYVLEEDRTFLISYALNQGPPNMYYYIPDVLLEQDDGQALVNIMDLNQDGIINIQDIIMLVQGVLTGEYDWDW